ncbi:hypothetical protein PLANPX_3375 [Lacipirellula parvula]|uniref:Uncharacterized protein n=1 Tax=Lacipirellula parvula TaxID=2650471 RepID=A0A5K7XHU0_9BACT|nr:hypothetical protein PLANPX_3375 [Lacipirellula parvula]
MGGVSDADSAQHRSASRWLEAASGSETPPTKCRGIAETANVVLSLLPSGVP